MSRKPPIELPQTDDPYVLLDVRPGASAEQIRRAYLRRVKVYKPDRHPAEFRRIREAYDRLREHERWFDAWRQASEVVRKAAEAAAAAAEAGEGRDADEEDGFEDEDDEDVDALIAALEEELREGRDERFEPDEADEDDDLPQADAAELALELGDRRKRTERVADTAERLVALECEVHGALTGGRSSDAAALLLSSEAELLASHTAFGTLLLEVCCAVIWDAPGQFEALRQRYGDLVSTYDTEHRDGALLHRRLLTDELPAWRLAVASWPELERFVALGSSLRAPAEAELGLRLGRRAADDPAGFLRVLVVASAAAPGILACYVSMAERWSKHYGKIAVVVEPANRPTVERAAQTLAHSVQHDRWVRWEQLRPLLLLVVLVSMIVLTRSPLVELLVIGAVLVLWGWNAWVAPSEVRIYDRVVRPAAAGWLWSTHATPQELATALRQRLPPSGTWAAVLHPGNLEEYPERLADDLALLAFGETAPMIPLLSRPRGSGPGSK
ncbi:J domain-containing protein [Paraliomyxa miuraensis]|uniref:J domain-containing protein n=1 Tax=Paraliomyxa miuraensis TaxID=376150 RepID=UPI00225BFEA6|nr:J domain-containing protein [Paraliomyxa miuraensis]MCX4244119.1 J domain-containing protein [Paraliomyxa miuraensis]